MTKVLKEERQHQSHHQPEKWMADLAIASVHLKEGNTFARYREIEREREIITPLEKE